MDDKEARGCRWRMEWGSQAGLWRLFVSLQMIDVDVEAEIKRLNLLTK